MPLVSFYTPWKQQKTSGFLMFSGGIKRDLWHEMGWLSILFLQDTNIRSSRPEVFFRKGVLKICSKFTGEHPCQIVSPHGCSPTNLWCIFRTPFPKKVLDNCFCNIDKAETCRVFYDKFSLIMRKCSERRTRNSQQKFFRKVCTRYMRNFDQFFMTWKKFRIGFIW